jgi:hypothetical protein
MLVVSVVLLTLWLGAQVFQVGMGGLVHLFAVTALLIVLLRKTPRTRHA